MKTLIRPLCSAALVTGSLWLLAGAGWAAPAATNPPARAAASAAAAEPAPFTPPQSVFVWNPNDPGFGRDPFFPNSPRNGRWAPPRRVEKVTPPITPPTPTATNGAAVGTPPPTPPPPPPREVKLDLSGIGGRKTAVINNISFLKGETGRVNTPDGPVRIRLDEILTDSVRVTIWLDDSKTVERVIPLSGR